MVFLLCLCVVPCYGKRSTYYLACGELKSDDFIRFVMLMPSGVSEVVIIINSTGGTLYDLLGILSTVEKLKSKGIKVVTLVQGIAASAAFVLWQVGDYRMMTPSSAAMYHGLRAVPGASLSASQRKYIESVQRKLNELAAHRMCGPARSEVEAVKLGSDDIWFDSESAQTSCLVDEIVQSP
ncbi:MAG: ATP-dependent Clp protease proteolytic subunit [Candidatus Bilamarchaeaceae archaeon]